MKKITIIILAFIGILNVNAQTTTVNKSYSSKNLNSVKLKFDYPNIVKLQTWDKNEVVIEAKVLINDGMNNDAFELTSTTNDNVLSIEGKVNNIEDLPKRYIIENKNGKYKFSSKAEVEKFNKENSATTTYRYGQQTDIEIEITIYIPTKLATDITSTYGLIEVKEFAAPLKATSPYKGVDVVISKENVGKLSAQTSYGEILTNINFDMEEKESRDFHTYFKANVGNGFNYKLSSKYGKLYLRKSKNG